MDAMTHFLVYDPEAGALRIVEEIAQDDLALGCFTCRECAKAGAKFYSYLTELNAGAAPVETESV